MNKKAFLCGYYFALGYLYAVRKRLAEDSEEQQFVDINGTPVPIKKNGMLGGKVGKKIQEQQVKKAAKENTTKELADFLGHEHRGVKGAKAIETLVKAQHGHVKGAFTREGIGEIDLVWGDENGGLCHIIKRRTSQNINIDEFLDELPSVIENGKIFFNTNTGNREIKVKSEKTADGKKKSGKTAIIAPTLRGKQIVWLLTAFNSR